MENFVAIVLILSSVSAAPTTSITESSEFMDPRKPTFFERQFFTALDVGARLSKQILPKVMATKLLI